MTSSPPASVIGAVVAAESTLHSPDEASSPPPAAGGRRSMPISVKTPSAAMSYMALPVSISSAVLVLVRVVSPPPVLVTIAGRPLARPAATTSAHVLDVLPPRPRPRHSSPHSSATALGSRRRPRIPSTASRAYAVGRSVNGIAGRLATGHYPPRSNVHHTPARPLRERGGRGGAQIRP